MTTTTTTSFAKTFNKFNKNFHREMSRNENLTDRRVHVKSLKDPIYLEQLLPIYKSTIKIYVCDPKEQFQIVTDNTENYAFNIDIVIDKATGYKYSNFINVLSYEDDTKLPKLNINLTFRNPENIIIDMAYIPTRVLDKINQLTYNFPDNGGVILASDAFIEKYGNKVIANFEKEIKQNNN